MKRRADGNRGSVLIVVMWSCLSLVALALVFGQSMAMNYRGAGNDVAGRQADAAVEGAMRYAKTLLANETVPGVFPDPTTYQCEAVPVGDATFWYIGGGYQDPVDNRVYGLVDEASKLNVNSASSDVLELLPGMTPDFAEAITAWRSQSGDDSTASGSVSGLGADSYTPKGAAFETPEEVGMVNGADKTYLYGEDTNLNGALDPNEDDGDKTPPTDNSDGKLDAGLLSFITTFTREPNTRADGTPRINISNVRNAGAQITQLFAQTPTLTGRAPGVLAHFPRDNPSVNSVLEFYVRSGLSATDFAAVADAFTVKDPAKSPYLSGLVNINTAPLEVLTAIPGIGSDMANTIIGTRQSRTVTDVSIAWVGDLLGPANSHLAGPYLTGASYQACVDVAAVGRNGRGYRRTRFVMDTSTGTPRVIYRRDLANLGWALGANARQLATQTNVLR